MYLFYLQYKYMEFPFILNNIINLQASGICEGNLSTYRYPVPHHSSLLIQFVSKLSTWKPIKIPYKTFLFTSEKPTAVSSA